MKLKYTVYYKKSKPKQKTFFKNLLGFVTSFGFLMGLGFAAAAVAAVTISNTGITGDSSFSAVNTATSTVIDTGSSSNTLSLQTVNNGLIRTGSGLFTISGSSLFNSTAVFNGAVTNNATTTFASSTFFSGISPSSLLYATSTGQLVPLTLGTNLSISLGTLNATGGGGSGTPGGLSGQIQVNNSGSFAGQAFALSGGSSTAYQRAIECAKGTVSISGGTWTYPGGTVAAASTTSQDIPIITGLTGDQRYTSVLISEATIFASASLTGTKISVGRSGNSTNDEMLPQTPFMQSSGNNWFAEDVPQAPVLGSGNTYNISIGVRTIGGNVSALTSGAVNYEICGYKAQ
jgi:hypothetical protein